MSIGERCGIVPALRRTFVPVLAAVSAALLGCDSPTAVQRDSEAPIQTELRQYELSFDSLGFFHLAIPYAFTNQTGGPVYIPNCLGSFLLHLEREVDGEWRTALSPLIPMCLSAPIVIADGARFVDTLEVVGGLPGSRYGDQFDVADPTGTYRLVWDDALSSYQESQRPHGPELPIDARVSNRFTLTTKR
jgi:hypothetical protein